MESPESVETKAFRITLILANIISFLPDQDLVNVRLVNKAFDQESLSCIAKAKPRRRIWINVNARNLMTKSLDDIKVPVQNIVLDLNWPSTNVDYFWSTMFQFFDTFHEGVKRMRVQQIRRSDDMRAISFHKIWNTFVLPNLQVCYLRQKILHPICLLPKPSVRKVHLKRPSVPFIESVLRGCPNLARLETMNRTFRPDVARISVMLMMRRRQHPLRRRLY